MINGRKQQQLSQELGHFFLAKGWLYLLLIAGLLIFCKLIPKGLPMFMGWGVLPLGIVLLFFIIVHSKKGFYTLFIVQFLLLIASSITDVRLGVITLIVCLIVSVLFIIRGAYEQIQWKEGYNGMILLYLVWGGVCIAELANPNNVQEAWNISITHYLIYPVLCAFLVPMAVRNIKGIEWLLLIWSLFVLYAVFKGYWQKTYGFNAKELHFLYEEGGAKTHIIWSGIRYFSCFSDAANYGVHMAMAITTFGLSAFFTRSVGLKIYFAIITLLAIYGMGISGTRAAITIPLGGLGLFILLSRNWKTGIIGLVALLSLFFFFSFTNIGDGNQYIRKMRSAFRPSADASYQLRILNRERMKELMSYKPFGYGIGLSKGDRFYPKERMPYPPDSWLISVWVETGIIGLTLYLMVHGALFAWCSWILMFKIKDKRLRGLLTAWLCMDAGFFVAAYANDVMQYPNSIIIYTGFALCFSGPHIDKQISKEKEKLKKIV